MIGRDGWKSKADTTAQAPYLTRGGAAPGVLTYDDPKSTKRKVSYALGERGLGGVFMWSLDGDYDGRGQDLLDAMHKAVTRHSR